MVREENRKFSDWAPRPLPVHIKMVLILVFNKITIVNCLAGKINGLSKLHVAFRSSAVNAPQINLVVINFDYMR